MTETFSRTIGRASASRRPSGRRISTSCIEAARRGRDLHHAGVEPAQVGVDLAQRLDLDREVRVVERVVVGVEALVGRRAAAGRACRRRRRPRAARSRPRASAPPRRSRSNGRSPRSRPHRAQAEALGGVVARGLQAAVVEDQRLGAAPLEEQLAVVGAGGRGAQERERGVRVERGLEGAETGGVASWSVSPGQAARGVRRKPRLVLSPLIWFICPRAATRLARRGRAERRARRDRNGGQAMSATPTRPSPAACRDARRSGGAGRSRPASPRTCR